LHKNTFAAGLILLLAVIANGFQSKDWVRYESPEGRFAVLMPEQPEVNTQEGKTPSGAALVQHQAKSSGSDSLYSLGYFDLEANSSYSLDKGRDGIVSAVKGTLISEQAISLGGNAGRELTVSAKAGDYDFFIRVRLYEISGRVYVLQHAFTKLADSPTMSEKTTKFFDSFKVTVVNGAHS
jgi:hypothetical protein